MMSMKQLRWLLSGLLLQISTAQAADANGEFVVKGAGLLPCNVYTAEREKRSNIYYLIGGWLEGFLSAHNKYAADTYDVVSFEGLELLLAIIDNHCRANPQDRLFPVVNTIVAKLNEDRIRSKSAGIELAEGERKTVLYRETIQRIQEKLKQLGLFHAEIDGMFNDATRSAVIAFQTDIGFETTGFPDQATLWRLFRR
ncbi:MAG: peptidoglycan-binding protein [Chromatiaceae bacterium]|nr:peptidoglycan-binding protein [Chromatiaceae bacterium]MCP5443911.1 peptidoglycan-binding protein [Chromatiaceae bacterium]